MLSPVQVKKVCVWVKQLKFPNGYVSNIARGVNVIEGKIYGMKSHDCHIFMQRLLPLAFCDMLPKPIWGALAELNQFFRYLCIPKLHIEKMELLEKNIVEIIYKLEKIFPSTLFNSIEHLPIHLLYEAKVGGPVQYRWMCSFER